ncbi:MAG: Na+/H+ antiporter subunit C [Labilithrix sp.]|nr:Na+/H+ antiporter subunit C [Labilithrix sp.]
MAALIAILVGVLYASATYLVLRRRTFPVILGVTLAAYATNLFLLASGRVAASRPPIIEEGATGYADPLPQALVLTAIVISFGMTAFLVVLAIRARVEIGTDEVDGAYVDDEAREDAGERAEREGADEAEAGGEELAK